MSNGFLARRLPSYAPRRADDIKTAQSSSVGRRIWGSPDAIMLVFAGSAAEFALNKAVDWLFWTNALPDAPIERFFETVCFAQELAFGDEERIEAAVAAVNRAHHGVERSRGEHIPQWAYRDVLFMLIDYGERAYEIVFGPMTEEQRAEHFRESIELGRWMHIHDLPETLAEFRIQRHAHLHEDLEHSALTDTLYERYRCHLGRLRMKALLDLQGSLVPSEVARLLRLRRKRRVDWLFALYRHLRSKRLLRLLYPIFLPSPFGAKLAELERPV